MAGAKAARGVRGRYTTTGYASDRPGLYIADDPAGSARDNLRDYNRVGYAPGAYVTERPWRNAPKPEEQEIPAPAAHAAPHTPRAPRREDWGEKLSRMAVKERRDVVVCIVLAALILMILASWGQKMVEGVRIQNSIADIQAQTLNLERENERIAAQIELAKNGERIRNDAQNTLGMLRPERANHETIFIQTSDLAVKPEQETVEEPKMELLDVLLGLLSVFHIGE